MPDEPRRDRDDDDAADEAGRDFDALGTLDDVRELEKTIKKLAERKRESK